MYAVDTLLLILLYSWHIFVTRPEPPGPCAQAPDGSLEGQAAPGTEMLLAKSNI